MANDYDHKLTIDCPVARNPEIFVELNAAINLLNESIKDLKQTAKEARTVATSAKKKVDFLYWFFGAFGGIVGFGTLIYTLFIG